MSTLTNLRRPNTEGLSSTPTDAGFLVVNDKRILAQLCDKRNQDIAFGLMYDQFADITAPCLYGVLRAQPIERAVMVPSDPLLIFFSIGWHLWYYKIPFAEFRHMMDYYCSKAIIERSNWLQEGF